MIVRIYGIRKGDELGIELDKLFPDCKTKPLGQKLEVTIPEGQINREQIDKLESLQQEGFFDEFHADPTEGKP